ncbi:MAG: CHASE2 domain-containing protein, partial [Planctomycetota bacterium]
MTNVERRNLIRTSLVGASVIAVILLLDAFHMLDGLNNQLYHARARYFQFFQLPPTKSLVHLDIDDASLELIGAFPWPRSHLAEIVDELRLAGAEALATDIIFPEPQEERYVPRGEGAQQTYVRVDDDRNFADALERFGKTLIPISLDPRP